MACCLGGGGVNSKQQLEPACGLKVSLSSDSGTFFTARGEEGRQAHIRYRAR